MDAATLIATEQVIVPKRMLHEEHVAALLDLYTCAHKAATTSLASWRDFADVPVPEDVRSALVTVLTSYGVTDVLSTARVYRTLSGDVKDHTDQSYLFPDGSASVYTVVVYLSTAAGGETCIRRRKVAPAVHGTDVPELLHERVCVRPVAGYGVMFNHSLTHCARNVHDGDKVIAVFRAK
jgi:hypothetical protein